MMRTMTGSPANPGHADAGQLKHRAAEKINDFYASRVLRLTRLDLTSGSSDGSLGRLASPLRMLR